ncbi:protein-L-isoaspartate(D-aspartate) O-methyltransferase [Alkalibacter mobilis]|uniref:protein-L-isoaspartate(D-aspartate) O-methyltransferase n=1 Tax=Alkalibacter mobilis TaxID=2787712 RepID=UPI00189C7474|nr:protein-L-isoaspartate(D-aspartate) O-methyltransferase [Alkalibacter mobilis]MBF7097529.1 protein-L-isoaspartate(D-aspartate) O-methyltransferase [Alkalibacter mobilis]
MDFNLLENYFNSLDRSLFLDDNIKGYANLDSPLPIGFGQTISQPSLVLEMTRILKPEKKNKVLEIGTGSGYQTALLSYMAGAVYTVEIIPELSMKAKERLQTLGIMNVFYKIGDGSLGWMEHSPFDRIMVTAAAKKIPLELMDQLNVEGRMVIPVGDEYIQELQLVTKDINGEINIQMINLVRFVELVGKYGWSSFDDK